MKGCDVQGTESVRFVYIPAKEPEIPTKETYNSAEMQSVYISAVCVYLRLYKCSVCVCIPAKEPYISAKETHISVKVRSVCMSAVCMYLRLYKGSVCLYCINTHGSLSAYNEPSLPIVCVYRFLA